MEELSGQFLLLAIIEWCRLSRVIGEVMCLLLLFVWSGQGRDGTREKEDKEPERKRIRSQTERG